MGCFSSKEQTYAEPEAKDPKESILLKNESKKAVMFYVVSDPDALRLKEKSVTSEGSAHAKAGAYGVGVGLGANKGSAITYEAAAPRCELKIQQVRINPGREKSIWVEGTSYIAVIFFRDDLYHFAIECQRVTSGSMLSICNDDLESEIPFKTSRRPPDYADIYGGSFYTPKYHDLKNEKASDDVDEY